MRSEATIIAEYVMPRHFVLDSTCSAGHIQRHETIGHTISGCKRPLD